MEIAAEAMVDIGRFPLETSGKRGRPIA